MNSDTEKICNALLYEGYALFPYRKNSLKNQKRFNFGVLSPKIWAKKQINEHFFQQTEFFVLADSDAEINFKIRFLQLSNDEEWQTAIEQEIIGSFNLKKTGNIEYQEGKLRGKIKFSITKHDSNVYKIRFAFENLTDVEQCSKLSREEILQFSFVSTHTIFEIEKGKFISLLETPDGFTEATKSLENIGVFPVLIGDKAKQNNILSSPIILYDFPVIAEKSFDNFFDGLEIDELMILNLMALSEDEKRQIAETDERTKQIIEKIENLNSEDLLNLHAHLR